ncbi:MAG: hypothetical protein KFF77_09115 [Bacteroidetes bacterium]|nr:hypothetical protein [Bacteroidota bacterium]
MNGLQKTSTTLLLLIGSLLVVGGAQAQQKEREGDKGDGHRADTLRRPFTENADRYIVPVFPQFWFGAGAWFAKPDLGSLDAEFLPGDRPSNTKLSPAFFFAARIQISRRYSSTVSAATVDHGRGGYSRFAVSLCGHLPFSDHAPSDLFAGIGVARVNYSHDGATGNGVRLRINAGRNAVHLVAGLNIIIPNGPGLVMTAGFETMAEEKGLDLSTPFANLAIMF